MDTIKAAKSKFSRGIPQHIHFVFLAADGLPISVQILKLWSRLNHVFEIKQTTDNLSLIKKVQKNKHLCCVSSTRWLYQGKQNIYQL